MNLELKPAVCRGRLLFRNSGTTQGRSALTEGKAAVRLDNMATRARALRPKDEH